MPWVLSSIAVRAITECTLAETARAVRVVAAHRLAGGDLRPGEAGRGQVRERGALRHRAPVRARRPLGRAERHVDQGERRLPQPVRAALVARDVGLAQVSWLEYRVRPPVDGGHLELERTACGEQSLDRVARHEGLG